MSITSPVTDAASLVSAVLGTELVVIRPKAQPARSAKVKATAHCGVANGESNASSQFCRFARAGVSRLWIFDQTAALKPVGRSACARLASALRSSSKRDSFIFLSNYPANVPEFIPPHLFQREKRLNPSKFRLLFFHGQRFPIPTDHILCGFDAVQQPRGNSPRVSCLLVATKICEISSLQSSNRCARLHESHRTLRDGSLGWRCPRHFVPWSLDISRTDFRARSEEHTSELQSRGHLVCRLLL